MNLSSGVLNDGHDTEQEQHTAPAAFRRWSSALFVALLSVGCGSSSGGTAATAPASGGSSAAGGATGGGGATSAGGASSVGGASSAGAGGSATAGSTGSSGAAGQGGTGAAGATGVTGDYDPVPVGGDRPTKVYVPSGYVAGTPMPVVILLHGYGASGAIQEAYFQLKPEAEKRGFLYAHPDGTPEPSGGKKFWNATDACCDFGAPKIDDVAYLSGLVTEIASRWTIDPKRVHFVGHSNGGFMSHRMACDKANVVASIVSLAGDNWNDASKCQPSEPVSVLQIHGTADMTIAYDGGMTVTKFPSAQQSVLDWVALDGCDATPDTSLPPLDLETTLAGDETTKQRWATGCKASTDVELWTIVGGGHIPSLNKAIFAPDVADFLFAHPKN